MYKYFIMESFYWTVLVIAVLALIAALSYVGILMAYYTGSSTTYPPAASSCPDLWRLSDANTKACVIPPTPSSSNVGTIYTRENSVVRLNLNAPGTGETVVDSDKTPGLDSSKTLIDFTDARWGSSSNATCAKKRWADQYGLFWDGVTNFNGC
jgi:hypothetical protein